MPTVGFLNGRNLRVYVNGNAVADATSGDLSVSQSSRDVTTKDSAGWMEVLYGLKEWSISGDGLVALDATFATEELIDFILNSTTVTIRFTTNVSGDTYWTGSAIAESVDVSSPNEETPTFSFSFKGDGALTKASLT